MPTTWTAPLSGLPAVAVAVLVGVLGVVGFIWYCRAGQVPDLPPRRDVLEFCAARLAVARGRAEAAAVVDALDAFGQADPEARQAVLDVICGYLRRPVQLPGDTTPIDLEGQDTRATAQVLLHTRLVPQRGGDQPWVGLHLDLRGASLQDLDLHGAVLRSATFTGTRFHGTTRLSGIRCAGRAVFTDAVFAGPALVDDADFNGPARFTGTRFDTTVSFTRTTFRGRVDLAGARFCGAAEFGAALFLSDAALAGADRGPAQFLLRAGFERACFMSATFAGVDWPADTSFHHAEFAQPPHLLNHPPADTVALAAQDR